MKKNSLSVGKQRKITGNILIVLNGLMLIGSTGAKLAHVPDSAQ
jgi:hypothetical protein